MKAGIITFHFAHNYGAMLQAYALQEKLKSLGCDTYIIDYRPSYHTKCFSRGLRWSDIWARNPIEFFKRLLKVLLFQPAQKNRYNAFDSFINNHLRLYPFSSELDFSQFDVVFLGSDQIWDLNHTNGVFDAPYYGDHFKCRVVSYAASSKMITISKEQEQGFRERLNRLYMIGVRETSLKTLLQPLVDKKIFVNLDPTLMVNTDVYERLILKRPTNKRYVLIYEIYEHKEVKEIAKAYARQHKATVISLVAFIDWKNRILTYDQEASPEKFLAYLKYAECVFTTSFHGTALSLVFHKPFYTFIQNTPSDLRMKSLLSQLGLLNHFVDMTEPLKSDSIDYTIVQERLEKLRMDSNVFLSEALSHQQ